METECILCGYKERGGILLRKDPEGVYLCVSCSEDHPDHNHYDGDEEGRALHMIGSGDIQYLD